MMETIEKDINLNELMLDNNNPRFGRKLNKSQIELQEYLLCGSKSKELLTSMKSGLVWMNKIVITPLSDISEEEREGLGIISPLKKYVIVEGNTRAACLLHKTMMDKYGQNAKFPMIVVKKSENESEDEFLKERKRVQSIANIMVVKDWREIPKARHLYEEYKIWRKLDSDKGDIFIFKELGEDIGITVTKVKDYIYRYTFFKELSDNEELEDEDFKYFEIFEQSKSVRELFGYENDLGEFIWNSGKVDQEDAETIEKKKELLYLMPKIIEVAKSEKVNSKKLRDMLRKYKPENMEDLLQKFKDISKEYEKDDYSYDSLENILDYSESGGEKRQKEYERSICKFKKMLRDFPINQNYAMDFKSDLNEINVMIKNILKYFNIQNNEDK